MKTLAALTLCILATALALEAPAANIGAAPGTLLSYQGTNILPRSSLDSSDFGWDGTNITVKGNDPFDGDMQCGPLTNVEYIVYGCGDDGSVRCVVTTECFTVYSETNSSTLNSDWIWTAGEWSSSPQYEIMNCVTTTGEVCSQEVFNYSFTNTACIDREVCYTLIDGSWVLNEERGPEYVGGNTINLTGTGTLIIDATATGNTIIGENNGDIYIGRGSKDNTLRGTVAVDGVVHVGTNNIGNTILCDVRQDGSIHIGNSNTLNIIQAYLDDSEFSMRTANRLNKIAVHGYTYDNLKIMDHVDDSIIAATKKSGTDTGIGWMVAESRNLTIGAGNETLAPFTMFTVSNTVGCIVNVATNMSGVTNAVIADALYVSGASLHVGETHLTETSSSIAVNGSPLGFSSWTNVLLVQLDSGYTPAVGTNIIYDSVIENDGGWSAEDGWYVVQKTGQYFYSINACANSGVFSTSTTAEAIVCVNGTKPNGGHRAIVTIPSTVTGTSCNLPSQSMSGVLNMTSGDVVYVRSDNSIAGWAGASDDSPNTFELWRK